MVATQEGEGGGGGGGEGRLHSFISSILSSISGVFTTQINIQNMNTNRAVVVPHNRGEVGGKQKNGQADGRNRCVLGDIGNLVTGAPVVEGKPKAQIPRPATRSFSAQLPAAQAEKNKVKPLAEVVNKVPAKKKVSDKPAAQETVIVISPDQEVKKKTTEKSHLSKRKAKKTGKTLTSTLTARSKAACGLSNRPKNEIDDIDAADAANHLAIVEYVEDIYNFYKLTEDESLVNKYMEFQPELNHKMRAILVDWLIEVHTMFELMPESLYLTVNILDRFLSMKTIPRKELQIVGISSMLIACKYEEISAPEVNDFMLISDNAYTREHILQMEKAILGKLEWYLTVPTPYVFLVRYIKAAIPSDDQEIQNMSFFFAELGLMNYSTTISCCPSMLAASSVYAARCTLNKSPLWTPTLQHYTGYSEEQLMECTKQLVSYHKGAAKSKLKAIYTKFSRPDRGAVANLLLRSL